MRAITSHVRIIEANDHRTMPWKNGLGITREIAVVSRNPGEDFDWRLSIANITADADFSSFDGYARTIVLLEGRGMQLICDGVSHELSTPFTPFDFDGGAMTQARLLAGPVRDFNIMSALERCGHEWQLVRDFPFVLNAQPPASHALFCFSGRLSLQIDETLPATLAVEETLLVDTAATKITVDAADEGCCALLIRFVPR